MDHVGLKTRSVGQIIGNLVNTPEATVLVQSSSNLVKIKYGSCWVLTRPVGQIIEKPCEHFREHSSGPIFIKLAQNDHLDNIWVKFKYGSSWVKN